MLLVFFFWLLFASLMSMCFKPCGLLVLPSVTTIDAYEERPTSLKTNKVVRSRNATHVAKVRFWFPNAMKEDIMEKDKEEPTNIFLGATPVSVTNDAIMRIHLYVHDGEEYQSLLTQPIVVDSQFAASTDHNLSVYLKQDYSFQPDSVLIVQREYFRDIDFPNLVSIELQ